MSMDFKSGVIAVLVVGVAATGAYAWKLAGEKRGLEGEVAKLKAARLEAPAAARAEARRVTARRTAGEGEAVAEKKPEVAAEGQRRSFSELMKNPEFVGAMALRQRAGLDGRYADLFRQLKLSPTELERLKGLLVERGAASMDVRVLARDQNLSAEDLAKVTADLQGEVDGAIKALLGEEGYDKYKFHEESAPARVTVKQVETRLSYGGEPLSAEQSDFLLKTLAATVESPAEGRRAPREVAITDAMIAEANGVLTKGQVKTLREIQREQQASVKMSEMFGMPQGGGNGGGGGFGGGGRR